MSLVYTRKEFERPPHPSFALINQATPPPPSPPSSSAADFSAGTKEDWREDADDFPEEALGEPLGDWEGEVWVDVNNEVWMGVAYPRRVVWGPASRVLWATKVRARVPYSFGRLPPLLLRRWGSGTSILRSLMCLF